jgi:hypothetical protein
MDSCEAEPGYGGYKKGETNCAGATSGSAEAPRVLRRIPQRRMATKKFLV